MLLIEKHFLVRLPWGQGYWKLQDSQSWARLSRPVTELWTFWKLSKIDSLVCFDAAVNPEMNKNILFIEHLVQGASVHRKLKEGFFQLSH